MSDQDGAQKRIAIVTVHGTNDLAIVPEGPKWFQIGSEFAERLRKRIAARGLDAEIVPHLWTGANSAIAREAASDDLVKTINRLAKTHPGGVHLLGHSHGGNVANDAACMLGWSHKQRRPKIASVTTVGTPFFRTKVLANERFGAWVFLVMITLSVLIAAFGTYGVDYLYREQAAKEQHDLVFVEGNLKTLDRLIADYDARLASDVADPQTRATLSERRARVEADKVRLRGRLQVYEVQADRTRRQHAAMTRAIGLLSILSAVSLLFSLPLAMRGIRRIRRASRRARADTEVHAIWHPNDEAISFLQRIEGMQIEPFPRGSLFRGSRTGAIMGGVTAVIAVPVLGLVGMAMAAAISSAVFPWLAGISPAIVGTPAIVLLSVGLAGAPLVFLVTYALYRIGAAFGLELIARRPLNNLVGGSLKGIAFGRDGDIRICEVSPRSHYYGSRCTELGGEVAERMHVASTAKTRELFDKYRGALFSVSADTSNALAQLTQDAMTWDSLIHTTYFDQPEVADMIGDIIAEADRPAGPTSSQLSTQS